MSEFGLRSAECGVRSERPIRVLHVIDGHLRWDERLAIEQLLDRLTEDRFSQRIATLGRAVGEAERLAARSELIPCRFAWDPLAPARLRRRLQGEAIDLVHAWGRRAAACCVSALNREPLAMSLSEPTEARQYARICNSSPERGARGVLCSTEIIRRRLVERGVPPAQAVLIRPGLNFAAINQAKKSDLRARLGVSGEGLMLLTDAPASREGGQFCAFWAAAVRRFLEPGVRIVVPGRSREVDRLRRLVRGLRMDDLLITPGDAHRLEDLIAVADVLLMPAAEETAVTAIAWAMASGVSVVAAATRATAELLAHGHNAFLIKPDVTKRLALRIAAALEQRGNWAKQRETARGQAFEVFGLRRFVDQTARAYENLIAGRAPTEGINDPALVGA